VGDAAFTAVFHRTQHPGANLPELP
jgi:hypothetical protein